MKRTTPAIPATLLAATAFSALAAAPTSSISNASLRPELTEIRETRSQILKEDDSEFSIPSEQPGIQLQFSLSLPDNLTLLSLAQPTKLSASDSSPRDLTNIKEGYSGDKEFVSLVNVWDEPPTEFTFQLSPSSRNAPSFSLEAQFVGLFFAETKTRDIPITSDWTIVPAELTSGQQIKFRAEQGSDSINLHLQPGTAKELFASLTLKTSAGELETNGSMWSDRQATFWFQGELEESMTLTMEIRVGLQEMPIYINIEDQPLP